MQSEPTPERGKARRPYVPPHKRRKRGGQAGNRNALTHGAFTPAERARRRATFDLLADIRWALAATRRFQPGYNVCNRGLAITNKRNSPGESMRKAAEAATELGAK